MNETTKIFVPDGNNDLATIAAMNNGGFGGNQLWNNPIWALAFLGIFANGGFFGGNFGNRGNCTQDLQLQAIREQLTNNQNSTLLMDAIKGNSNALSALATNLNLSKDAVTAAVNGVQSQVAGIGNQMGMNALQVINAINSGNSSLAAQLSQCCCENKLLATQQGYESRIAIADQTNALQNAIGNTGNGIQSSLVTLGTNNDRNFASMMYQMQTDACNVEQNSTNNTNRIIAKLDQIEDSRKDREINALTAQLAAVNARAERAAELSPVIKTLEEIKGRQPNTVPVQWPQITAIPTSQLYGYGFGPWNSTGQWS